MRGEEAALELPEGCAPLELPEPKRAAIVSAVTEGERVTMTVRVQEEDGSDHLYTGSLPIDVLVRLDPDEQRRALGEAVRVERDRARLASRIDLGALTKGDIELW